TPKLLTPKLPGFPSRRLMARQTQTSQQSPHSRLVSPLNLKLLTRKPPRFLGRGQRARRTQTLQQFPTPRLLVSPRPRPAAHQTRTAREFLHQTQASSLTPGFRKVLPPPPTLVFRVRLLC